MGYRVPSERVLRDAIAGVVARSGGVGSLTQLTALVAAELERRDARLRVSTDRVRRLAALIPEVRLRITTRPGAGGPLSATCPVCGSPMRAVRNRTLKGQEVFLEARCRRCPYWTGRTRRIPTRYTFQAR
jgi:hypothetical protein